MKKLLILGLSVILTGMFIGHAYSQTYVGPEKCLQCHGAIKMDASGWRTSMHANGYSAVLDDANSMQNLIGIVADANQNGVDDFKDGLDFNTISSAFDPYKPNAPILAYDAGNGYTITIGEVTHRVYLTYGGSGLYKQRFAVKINTTGSVESADHYISPIQYNENTHEYVLYHPEAWYDGNNLPIYTANSTLADAALNSRSLTKGCSGCHTTGLQINPKDANGEWTFSGAGLDPSTLGMYADKNNVYDIDGDGTLDQINIGCERCHGPGGDHALTADKTKIINPRNLTSDEANNICGMCHSRGKSKPNNIFGFPYDDQNLTSWSVGQLVADLYTDGGGYWGDGKNSIQHQQQFYDFYRSEKSTHQVRCYECHDVHNTVKHHIREEIEEEDSQGNPIMIATDNDNNTLCLACHAKFGDFKDISTEMVADLANNEATIAAVVAKHTNHTYDPENNMTTNGASRCSKCHNPKIAKSAVAYDIHSHTFEAISPQKTLDFDMPSSCAVSCHNKNGFNFGVDMSNDTFTDWSEQTDKELAEHLLFWYENLWFHEDNGAGNIVNAAFTASPPNLDGDVSDPAWANLEYVTIPLANNKSVDIKAVNTATDLYMLFRWSDNTASFTRGGAWSYDGANWSTTSGQSEDRIGILWNMSIPESDWLERGCTNKCHRNVDNDNPGQDASTLTDDAYLPAGQKADMWHMKAARSLPTTSASGSNLVIDPVTHQVTGGIVIMNGFMDDKYVGEFTATEDGGRYGDAGGSTYGSNRNAEQTGPKYIETNPTDFMDAMVLRQSEIDNGEAVEIATLSAGEVQTNWDKYVALSGVVPERVLRDPVGSRGDVMQSAKWENGFWTTEIKRALDTGNPDDDVIFGATDKKSFGIALIDNGGGDDHWTQGKSITTLNIGQTDVADFTDNHPRAYILSQNYPNPFNPTTALEFNIPEKAFVNLAIYNLQGQIVAELVNGEMQAGSHVLNFEANHLPSGIYYYRLTAGDFSQVKKMALVK